MKQMFSGRWGTAEIEEGYTYYTMPARVGPAGSPAPKQPPPMLFFPFISLLSGTRLRRNRTSCPFLLLRNTDNKPKSRFSTPFSEKIQKAA